MRPAMLRLAHRRGVVATILVVVGRMRLEQEEQLHREREATEKERNKMNLVGHQDQKLSVTVELMQILQSGSTFNNTHKLHVAKEGMGINGV